MSDTPTPTPVTASVTIRGTRDTLAAKIGESELSSAKKAAVLEDLAAVDPKIDILQIDYHQHPYRSGTNVTWTLTEL